MSDELRRRGLDGAHNKSSVSRPHTSKKKESKASHIPSKSTVELSSMTCNGESQVDSMGARSSGADEPPTAVSDAASYNSQSHILKSTTFTVTRQ